MLTVSDIPVLLPVDVEGEAPGHGDLLAEVVGEGEEGVPAVEGEGLGDVVGLASQVNGGSVLGTGRVGVVPDVPDPLHSVGHGLPGLCLASFIDRLKRIETN